MSMYTLPLRGLAENSIARVRISTVRRNGADLLSRKKNRIALLITAQLLATDSSSWLT